MHRVGLRQLQQNAAAAVLRVRKGEPVEVTDRGRPVAIMVPWATRSTVDALEAAGRLSPAEGDLLDLGLPLRAAPRVERPSRILERMRAGER